MEQEILSSNQLHIVSDGWSSFRRDHYVNFLAVFTDESKKPLLLKAIKTDERQNGENIAKELDSVIQEVGEDKVVSIVTDNAANMKKAWKILQAKYPALIINGCGAHIMNLLVKDIVKLDRFSDIIEHSKFITSFVKNSNIMCKRFERIQNNLHREEVISSKRTLAFVVETRWYTHHNCLKRVLENKLVFKQY
jgi:hypothetical protein